MRPTSSEEKGAKGAGMGTPTEGRTYVQRKPDSRIPVVYEIWFPALPLITKWGSLPLSSLFESAEPAEWRCPYGQLGRSR
jgi:hypothetical protein